MKLCECGCGQYTKPARVTDPAWGWVKGEPLRFVHGHNARKPLAYTVDPETGCWVWDGAKTPYGTFRRNGVQLLAHRYFYELHKGPIPEGLQLDHLCRNPPCCNPDHLEPVTCAENVRRGRSTKITGEIADQVRISSERNIDLAQKYGVTPQLISDIRHGRKWVAA